MAQRRDTDSWARPVERLAVPTAPPGTKRQTVDGRRLTGPLQGFGQMWQKTYKVRVDGVSPADVIATWKSEYDRFWPDTNRFYAPVAGIAPGEVGLISGRTGPVTLSTGVMVLFADETSFTFMTPEGHPFAGWITFSAHEDGGRTVAQVRALIRSYDPLFEAGFMLYGNRAEDTMWTETLRALARRLGSADEPTIERIKVDRRRNWGRFGNVRRNAMLTGLFRRRSR